jgi:ribosome-associated translation inhibitor RaiA
MYAAIDALADKLTRRVRKRKERAGDHHASDARRQSLALAT